ncbi:MAG TPA: hypothetical protein VKV15_27870 [Bryobacteraceae bacterium]|nr:hypothetical protein [Bryobacteraceae bacterium]
MSEGLNSAERFVYSTCRQSFLSLWSYANPSRRAGKELCDILVVCEPDLIIFSVKNVGLSDAKDPVVGWKRWRKKAVEQSADQIYGAERWLDAATGVIRSDGSSGLVLPSRDERRIHRIAVALGSQGRVPIEFGDFGKGFVHVFDELSFPVLLSELDTITDFVSYLRAKENLVAAGVRLVFEGSEEDLMAFYLHNGRSFPQTRSCIIVGDDLWRQFKEKEEAKAKKRSDEDSYIWDRLIELWAKDVLHENLEFPSSLNNAEMALRVMAKENRFSRRILGKSFREFIDQSSAGKVRAQMLKAHSEIVYVFLALPHTEDRQFRVAELGTRCFVARGLHPGCKTVIGLATEQYERGNGFSFDLFFLYEELWTDDNQRAMERIQRDCGFFVRPEKSHSREDEYPKD